MCNWHMSSVPGSRLCPQRGRCRTAGPARGAPRHVYGIHMCNSCCRVVIFITTLLHSTSCRIQKAVSRECVCVCECLCACGTIENTWASYNKNTSENLELYLEFNLHRALKLAETVILNYVQLIHKELCVQIYEYAVPHGINYVHAFACSDHWS